MDSVSDEENMVLVSYMFLKDWEDDVKVLIRP